MTTPKEKSEKVLAAFDFDGTITTKDSMVEYLRFLHGSFGLFLGYVVNFFTLFAYSLGMKDRTAAKTKFLYYFMGKISVEDLHKKGKEFAAKKIPELLRPEAMKKLQWHKDEGHEVIIVSASFDYWLAPWCEQHNVKLICSRFAESNGRIQKKLDGGNCRGQEKVNRIQKNYAGIEWDKTYAYGDTSGDSEMLEWADEAHFKPFR